MDASPLCQIHVCEYFLSAYDIHIHFINEQRFSILTEFNLIFFFCILCFLGPKKNFFSVLSLARQFWFLCVGLLSISK